MMASDRRRWSLVIFPGLCDASLYGLSLHDHPLDAGPRQELVAGRVAAGVPHVEEQAAPVPVADVARQIVADPGRDRDEAPPAQELRDLRRPFPHPCAFLPTPAFQRASSVFSRSAQ